MNIAAYPKYDSYQEVKISWCEELPSHWTTQPIRNLFTESRRKNGDGKNKDYLSLMANRGIIPYSEKGDVGNKMPADLSGCKLVDVDDFVLNSMNFGIGSFGVSSLKGVCSSVYVILKANNPASIKYYERIFQHPQFQTFSQSLGNGILAHRCAIGWDELKNAHFPVPPVEEIQAIAAFLDGKCATIDEAVRIKEEQIRLLAERRQILIQQAVTRGLNPNAPMKDSGIDWIGQIPAHWEKSKLKYVLDTWTGYAFSSDTFCQDGIPILRIGDLIAWGNVSTEKAVCVPEKFASFDEQFGVRKGDILMAMTGGTIGKVSIYDSDQPALLNQRVCAFRPKGVFPLLLALYWMQTKLWDQHILLNSEGGAQPNISEKATIEMPIVLPPSAEERLEIFSFLSSSLERIGDAISLKESQITALREYKTSLINAAVTGKIKVF